MAKESNKPKKLPAEEYSPDQRVEIVEANDGSEWLIGGVSHSEDDGAIMRYGVFSEAKEDVIDKLFAVEIEYDPATMSVISRREVLAKGTKAGDVPAELKEHAATNALAIFSEAKAAHLVKQNQRMREIAEDEPDEITKGFFEEADQGYTFVSSHTTGDNEWQIGFLKYDDEEEFKRPAIHEVGEGKFFGIDVEFQQFDGELTPMPVPHEMGLEEDDIPESLVEALHDIAAQNSFRDLANVKAQMLENSEPELAEHEPKEQGLAFDDSPILEGLDELPEDEREELIAAMQDEWAQTLADPEAFAKGMGNFAAGEYGAEARGANARRMHSERDTNAWLDKIADAGRVTTDEQAQAAAEAEARAEVRAAEAAEAEQQAAADASDADFEGPEADKMRDRAGKLIDDILERGARRPGEREEEGPQEGRSV